MTRRRCRFQKSNWKCRSGHLAALSSCFHADFSEPHPSFLVASLPSGGGRLKHKETHTYTHTVLSRWNSHTGIRNWLQEAQPLSPRLAWINLNRMCLLQLLCVQRCARSLSPKCFLLFCSVAPCVRSDFSFQCCHPLNANAFGNPFLSSRSSIAARSSKVFFAGFRSLLWPDRTQRPRRPRTACRSKSFCTWRSFFSTWQAAGFSSGLQPLSAFTAFLNAFFESTSP